MGSEQSQRWDPTWPFPEIICRWNVPHDGPIDQVQNCPKKILMSKVLCLGSSSRLGFSDFCFCSWCFLLVNVCEFQNNEGKTYYKFEGWSALVPFESHFTYISGKNVWVLGWNSCPSCLRSPLGYFPLYSKKLQAPMQAFNNVGCIPQVRILKRETYLKTNPKSPTNYHLFLNNKQKLSKNPAICFWSIVTLGFCLGQLYCSNHLFF